MDPMDYTMDDGQASQQQGAAHQFQCQIPPSLRSSTNDFLAARAVASRESQHYDPIHDPSGWYQPNNTNAQSRPPYTTHQSLTQWGAPTYAPIHSWQGFSDVQSGNQLPDASSYRHQSFMGVGASPWAEGRGYDGASFGYSAYNNPLNGNAGPSDQASGTQNAAHATASNPHAMAQRRAWQASRAEQELVRNRASSFGGSAFATPEFARRRPDLNDAGASRGPQLHISPADHRSVHTRAARYSVLNRGEPPIPHRRRTAHGAWSSDDDEDAVPEMNAEESYRRSAELLFSPEDEERTMAAMRGAIAAGKKIPSKEAIASLISMTIDEVKAEGEEINCMICYNDFGTVNPEGIIESPLRLPKCKHIFGNVCIKKWFEDSDTCPYCRDKLPSEVSIRKTAAFETYRVARERERQLLSSVHRSRYAQVARHFPDDSRHERNADNPSPPSREDYEHMLNRGNDWGFSPPRPSAGDSPERRRQSRGRVANGRSAQQMFGRPISVGSARLIPSGHSQRAVILGLSPGNANSLMSAGTQRRPMPPSGLAGGPPPGPNTTPPRNRVSSGMSPSSAEEASPAVAVGSFAPPRDRLADQFRREMENAGSQDAWANLEHRSGIPNHPPLSVPASTSFDPRRAGAIAAQVHENLTPSLTTSNTVDSAHANRSSPGSFDSVHAAFNEEGTMYGNENFSPTRPRWSR